jgi:hypothetical protein
MRCARLLVGALFLLAGCGQGDGYSKLNLVEVTGKVTLDGAPLANARVRFEASDGTGAEGITDASGNYRLMHDSEHAGCTPGAKTVRITSGAALEEGADPETAAASEKIPAAYNSQSTLKADVSESNKTFDFDLQSKP